MADPKQILSAADGLSPSAERTTMTFTYPAVMRLGDDGRYTGYFPDLDDCTFEGGTIDEAIDAAIAAEKSWIEVQMDEDDEYGAKMPFISDHEDIPLQEGEFIRDIAVIMHFEVGYY